MPTFISHIQNAEWNIKNVTFWHKKPNFSKRKMKVKVLNIALTHFWIKEKKKKMSKNEIIN